MTASPKAVNSSPAKLMDGNKALAALFAAATASASPATQQHKIMTMSMTKSSSNCGHLEQDTKPRNERAAQTMSANNLISSLLNRSAQSSSLPPTKTTATLTTTLAKPSRATSDKAKATDVAGPSQPPKSSTEAVNNDFELRNLESWFDEDAERIDESQYRELADSGDANGWSADEMFKYNEKRHKIMSNFNHKTLSLRYTTPLPKNKSKLNAKLAAKLAVEIEARVAAEGRVTPESSDDDEQFERERIRRKHLKQLKQLDQLMKLGSLEQEINHSQPRRSASSTKSGHEPHVGPRCRSRANKPDQQLSDSSVTPATASSTSSSPRPIDSSIVSCSSSSSKSVTCSSRNILRASLG